MIIQKSEALTNRAKEIFGEDIVEAAYVTSGSDKGLRCDKDGILMNDVFIIIEFKNGKKVGIGASESGVISAEDF